MPIARLTSVSNWDGVLGAIRTFIDATGDWTLNIDLASPAKAPAAGGRDLVATNGDVLVGLRSTTAGSGTNRLMLFDGIPPYASGPPGPPDSLHDNSGTVMAESSYTGSGAFLAKGESTQFAGPFPTVTLFTDDPSTYCHAVVEVAAGRFRHIWFGNMRKFGTWTGGAYYAATRWATDNTNIDNPSNAQSTTPMDGVFNVDARTQWTAHYEQGADLWLAPEESVVQTVQRRRARGTVRGGFGHGLRSVPETPFSGFIALVPIVCWKWTESDTPATVRPIGQIPDAFEVSMRNLIPGDSYFLGAEEFVVFPLAQKRDPAERIDVENSGDYGFAYRVIP